MSAEIELDAAQALWAARMLEVAVHDGGPWTFEWGGIEIPASKQITAEGVVFVGVFPDVCYIERPKDGMLLKCKGTIVGMRRVKEDEHPGDTGFVMTWAVLARKAPVDH